MPHSVTADLAIAALAIAFVAFTWCSFHMSRASTRIREMLQQRHPAILTNIAPGPNAHCMKQLAWQSDFQSIWAALPLLRDLHDTDLSLEITRFKLASTVSMPSLAVLFCALVVLVQRL